MKIYNARNENYFDRYAGKDAWIKVFKPCDTRYYNSRSKIGYIRILQQVGNIGTMKCYKAIFVDTMGEDFYKCTEHYKYFTLNNSKNIAQTIIDQDFEVIKPVSILTSDEFLIVKDGG